MVFKYLLLATQSVLRNLQNFKVGASSQNNGEIAPYVQKQKP